MLTHITIASLSTMTISLIGIALFGGIEKVKRNINYLISLSIGVFLGVVFTDLIPEAIELTPNEKGLFYVLGGFLAFLFISHFVKAYHHHHEDGDCHEDHARGSGTMVLVGDFIHNFVDGVVITAAFIVSIPVGVATVVGVILHELPQEIAEFLVLIKSGYSKGRAIFLNFLTSGSLLVGALLAYFFLNKIEGLSGPLLGIAAGNLLYIAATDLVPSVFGHGKNSHKKFLVQFILILIGLFAFLFTLQFEI